MCAYLLSFGAIRIEHYRFRQDHTPSMSRTYVPYRDFVIIINYHYEINTFSNPLWIPQYSEELTLPHVLPDSPIRSKDSPPFNTETWGVEHNRNKDN